jgi:hypothetical protein
MQLGPSGFPFEKFVAELLKNQGYEVSTNNILQGVCVKHEVDVVAKKENKEFIVECKYHNQQGIRSDVKVSLYVHARFQDISKKPKNNSIHQGWLVTNTKFTDDAIQYGQCAGLHLVSWNHPHQNNLREMVEVSRLYPVTCLTSLSHGDKLRLLADNILLCKTIHQNPKLLQKYKFSTTRLRAILNECEKLCL